ncbi:hypothetical protein PR048_032486 [Dryococelus australis]|uniref:C2H2-type domain-containing protein n=1 Tax=Dryococelus australis TaxID=614101 RepID=A0ABQ9G6H4_9NEOP|nr:hypothetical protein PR048_032486 [Dryococelus australis]
MGAQMRGSVPYCKCGLCGKTMRRTSLRTHMQDKHQPSADIQCCFCDKVFRTYNSLHKHQSVYHREQRLKQRARSFMLALPSPHTP